MTSEDPKPLTRASVRRSSSVSPGKTKPALLRTGSINIGASAVTTLPVTATPAMTSTPPDSPVNKPRYMWETTTSSSRSVTKQAELAKEKPMYFTDIHTAAKKEDSHVIAGLLAQLAEKDAVILEQAAAIEGKDTLILQFTATCDRLKHDCEALADKAFEWKTKYVALVAASSTAQPEAPSLAPAVSVDDIDLTCAPPEQNDGGGVWRPALSRRASRNRNRRSQTN